MPIAAAPVAMPAAPAAPGARAAGARPLRRAAAQDDRHHG